MPCGLGMSMHWLQILVPLCIPVYLEGEFMMRNMYIMVLTCKILAMHFQMLMNMFHTSWDTVSAEGIRYSGLHKAAETTIGYSFERSFIL